MRLRIFAAAVGIMMALSPFVAIAAWWERYANERFAFEIETPPGFSQIDESDNGDGGVFESADGRAELRVWGGYLTEGDFKSEVGWRVQAEKSDGWAISYDHRTSTAASWSGSRSGRVVYARAIKGCDEATVYFRLEYDQVDIDSYHSIVGRLVQSLRPTC
jgi:hypothetical protein